MPFTPFHWGPGSLIGLSLFRIFDLPALLIASVIVDIKPFYPLDVNPFYGMFQAGETYFFSGISFFAAMLVYLVRLLVHADYLEVL